MSTDGNVQVGTSRLPYELTHFNPAYFGFALLPSWVFGFIHRESVAGDGTYLTAIFFLSLAAGMLAFAGLRFALNVSAVEKLLSWPSAVLCVLAAAVVAAPVAFPPGLIIVACVGGGLGVAGLYLSWSPFYSSLDIRDAVACAFGSMVVAAVFKLIVSFSPAPVALTLLVLAAALSPMTLAAAERNAPPQGARPQLYFSSARSSFPYVILLGVAMCAFIIGVVPGVSLSPRYDLEPVLVVVQCAIEAISALAVLWWVFLFNGNLHFTYMWRVIVIIVATALLFLPHIGGPLTSWALMLVAVAQAMLVTVVWTMLADAAHHSSASPYLVFSFAWVSYALPLAAGLYVGNILAAQTNSPFLVAVLSYALTVTAILTLNDRNFIEHRVFRDLDLAIPNEEALEGIDAKCERIGRERGLTEREVEVLELLCRGRSKNYIADTLFISENTVRSHARHIYRKLDVHSRQEAMDLLID